MPFKKGQSGNPGKKFQKGNPGGPGKPKKLPEIDKLMAEVLGTEGGETRESNAKKILDALFKQAQKGNTRAAEILLDRGYGKPKETLQVTGTIKSYTIASASTRKPDDIRE